MTDYERRDDLIMGRIEQKLDDHIRSTLEWRESVHARIIPLEELSRKLDTPLKVFTWILAAFAVVFVGGIAAHLMAWFGDHWK